MYRKTSLSAPGRTQSVFLHDYSIIKGPQQRTLTDGESQENLSYVVKPNPRQLLIVRVINEDIQSALPSRVIAAYMSGKHKLPPI